MDATFRKLLTYSYNIVGSYEDAKDLVQSTMEKYITLDKRHIGHEVNYLIKTVINASINFKNRAEKQKGYGMWLPEPMATESPDLNLIKEQTASYSLLVLMEKLNAKERAVFILKEAFGYSHDEIAEALDTTVENSRQLLARARKALDQTSVRADMPAQGVLEKYIQSIVDADLDTLESLLVEDIRLMADGGRSVKVIAAVVQGKAAASQKLQQVYTLFLRDTDYSFTTINHQPAICFYKDGALYNCHVLEITADGRIGNIFSIVAPEKLRTIA
ncbi:sigma-70 family RNA polymerase sigma factor [Dawidia soli]|uniref:Sigma-70 family RNA polymerase sigma factor n=1 Tax=Dawidia soli TaxID=2782352 RepID=A0AAP2GDN5_9BACT|nr:sigma-70 family RNA polymerase sigma factor [Dawidia soli]MBT1687514.1 sigma-70 family RNA polymerase sigma factor [Dawidia soli]